MIVSVKGDITEQNSEAIVNAANASLLAGSGVCGTIHQKAGKPLEEYCRNLAPCPTAQAVITPAFNLLCQYVIHAVGPRWYDGTRGEADLLAQTYDSIFALVKDNGIRSVAIPAISTGIYRFPLEQATQIAIGRARNFLTSYPEVNLTFVCIDDQTLLTYQTAINRMK